MKLVCPKDPEHKEFTVIAHITQEWKVDEKGEFIEVTDDCIDVTHRPGMMDVYDCHICGEIAHVLDDRGVKVRS